MSCEIIQNKDWFDYLAGGVTVISSLLTLLIAFRLFDRLSFKREIRQKQLETLFQLVSVLQNWTIYVGAKGLKETDDTSSFKYGFRIKFFDMRINKLSKEYNELFIREKLLFTYDWEEQNPLIGWSNNPFLPKKIADKIIPFTIIFPHPASDSDFSKVIYIDLDPFDKSIVRKERKRTNYIHDPDDEVCRSFESFCNCCDKLITEIENWLNEHKANDLNYK